MRVLVIGSGAREHALVHALQADDSVSYIICAPGNAGISAEVDVLPVDASNPDEVAELAVRVQADLVVIGPEVPLVAGAADAVRERGIPCFGPSKEAAQLEGSKTFAKQIMAEANVSTARAFVCTTVDEVAKALDELGEPYVVKDDGLAAGKGVIVTSDRHQALEHADNCFAKGAASVLVEEYLDGPEVSLFGITDGVTIVALQPAQDFKRVHDGDEGPNTGGMGAYSPLPWAPAGLVEEVTASVLQPMVDAMRLRGTPFAGLLYAGLALTSKGVRIIEFNARFGDPETQVVLARLKSPLGQVLLAAATGKVAELPPLQWREGAAVTVVVASKNYPDSPVTGDIISGLEEANALLDVDVLHAGTRISDDGDVVSAGGRVLSVTAVGETLAQARERAYAGVDLISLAGSHHRRDIAQHAAE
ncbi:MAG: phosphoribosylamine--glycine ligase [Actinobacteria bacterium]|uniref:phosphoribosylamine--glycine ligase n=1 Tax=freshwater metagenome TaxID=449393 RepID=A0A6J7FW36_9ZZZZ|nr:phosphoribosylamine--glycine ligase [Actinomycetota bacterium]